MRMSRFLVSTLLTLPFSAFAVWNPIGPYTGFTRDLSQSITNPDTYYCLTEGDDYSRVLVSHDHGDTWTEQFEFEYGNNLNCLDVSPSEVLFVGDHHRIWISADSGLTWQEVLCDDILFLSFCFHPSNDQIIWAAGNDYSEGMKPTFLSSSDGGYTWTSQPLITGSGMGECIAVCPSNPDRIYIGGWENYTYIGKLFRSEDGGISFDDVSSPLWIDDSVNSISFLNDNPDSILVGNDTGIYFSGDGGDSWVQVAYETKVLSISVSENDSSTVFCTHEMGCSNSTDGGFTWNSCTNGLFGGCFYNVIPSTSVADKVFLCSSVGLFCSDNSGVVWNHIAFDKSFGWVKDIEVGGSGNSIIYTILGNNAPGAYSNSELYRSDNNGDSWIPISPIGSILYNIEADPFDSNIAFQFAVLTGDEHLKLYKTTDGGSNWVCIDDYGFVLEAGSTSTHLIQSDPKIPGRYWSMGRYIDGIADSYSFVISWTDDYGESWSRKQFPDQFPNNTYGEALVIDPIHSDSIYVMLRRSNYSTYMIRTFDGGQTWETEELDYFLNTPEDMVSSSFQSGLLITDARIDSAAATSISYDAGNTWSGSGFNFFYCRDLYADHSEPETILAASYDYGVNISQDCGSTWYNLSDGLDSISVLTVSMIPGEYLLCGSSDDGMYRTAYPVGIAEKHSSIAPLDDEFEIFPNPSMGELSVSFEMVNPGYVDIYIYDISGRVVLKEEFGPLSSGGHVLSIGQNLEGTGISSGLYFCTVVVEGLESKTESLVILR